MRLRDVLIACVAGLAGLPPPALAWGPSGHRVIASIADHHLEPRTRREVAALLALEPGASLASIANWADRHREPGTARWHYLNLPRDADCVYVPARDCPDGQCVVAAIEAQRRRIETAATGTERLEALKYLVHFIGDVHQPLHVGFADDRGGNSYQLQFAGQGTNLHALWDSGLLRALGGDPQALAHELATPPTAPGAGDARSLDPVAWAEESCRIVNAHGFYPPRRLPATYPAQYEPVLRRRLQQAGLRLAAVLNRSLGATEGPAAD